MTIAGYIRARDRRLWILSIGLFSSSVGFAVAIPFISIYFHSELGLSLAEIGIFFGVAGVVRSVSQSLGGELSDHLGRYWVMVLAQALRASTFLLVAYAMYAHWGFIRIAGMILFNFFFGSLFQPTANATVADVVEAKNRTEGYAIIRVADNLGWAAGPAIGGYLAGLSFAGLFIISSIMTFISSGIIAFFLRGMKMYSGAARNNGVREPFRIKGNENIIRHAVLVFLLYLVIAQMIAPFSLYSVEFKGISKAQLGFLFTLNGLMVTFLQLPITRILRKARLTTQLALGAIFYALGFFWVGLFATFGPFIVAFALITMGENFVSPPALSVAANLAPEGQIGRYMGIYGFAVTAGWSLGPMVGGVLLGWAKPQFIYMWSVIAVLALLVSYGFRRFSRYLPSELNLYKK